MIPIKNASPRSRLKYGITLHFLLILILLLISPGVKSQDTVKVGLKDTISSASVEIPYTGKSDAKFMGGDAKKFNAWVQQNINYPTDALKKGIYGDVLIQYTITPTGKITDVTLLMGKHPLLDAEAVRVVQSSPDWEPAKKAGLNAEQRNVINVRFKNKMDLSNPQSAETDTEVEDTIDYSPAYVFVQLNASFQGGDINTFRKWMQQNLKYPQQAGVQSISGRLTVQFYVDSYGKVGGVKVLRSPDPQYNDETIRVIRSSPRWKPAMQNGINVKQQFVIPVYIDLNDAPPKP
jgi:TonB family protein